jgi:hypothetical protein
MIYVQMVFPKVKSKDFEQKKGFFALFIVQDKKDHIPDFQIQTI